VSAATANNIVVVDTDVASFIFKGDTRSRLYEPHLNGQLAIIAAQTRAELERWTLSRNWGTRRRNDLYLYLKTYFFAEVDETICLRWAEVQDNAQRKGRLISCADGWIAATALAYAAPLVTHNADDFKHVSGLTIITEK
jgi:tRNA(fMet)-specific endonuclease VapC